MKRHELIQARNKKDLTPAQIAKLLDISTVYVRKIEAGTVKPGRDTMIKFEAFYGVSMRKLFSDIFLLQNDKKFIRTGTE